MRVSAAVLALCLAAPYVAMPAQADNNNIDFQKAMQGMNVCVRIYRSKIEFFVYVRFDSVFLRAYARILNIYQQDAYMYTYIQLYICIYTNILIRICMFACACMGHVLVFFVYVRFFSLFFGACVYILN